MQGRHSHQLVELSQSRSNPEQVHLIICDKALEISCLPQAPALASWTEPQAMESLQNGAVAIRCPLFVC